MNKLILALTLPLTACEVSVEPIKYQAQAQDPTPIEQEELKIGRVKPELTPIMTFTAMLCMVDGNVEPRCITDTIEQALKKGPLSYDAIIESVKNNQ